MKNLRIVSKKKKTTKRKAEYMVLIKILNKKRPPCGTPDDDRNRLDDFQKRLTNC